MKLSEIRTEYRQAALNEASAPVDPLDFFTKWFDEAVKAQAQEVNAMCLSTVGDGLHPEARIVLLKGVDERGFQFFTNYHSDKGQALAVNPNCSLTFFWPELERQIRVNGAAERLSAAESDEYFASRPRGSQIGAWVSEQSAVLHSREQLEKKLVETESRYAGLDIPRPPHWGGFRVVPASIEFWQGRENRLHDRLRYVHKGDGLWKLERLYP